MTSKKNTNKALFSSVIALILCCSMLVGTTFAWFTDEVKSGVNQIVAGNLDVDVLTADGNSIQGVETLFNDVTLWEPGVVAYENLTVVNKGNLALKYELAISFANENTVNGKGLSSALKVALVNSKVAAGLSRENVLALAGEGVNLSSFNRYDELDKGESKEYTLIIWWAPSANDNDWNVNNGKTTSDGKPLHIDLGVKLVATQKMAEEDSFGPEYDKDALAIDVSWYDPAKTEYVLNTAAELRGLAAIVNGTAPADATVYSLRSTTAADSFTGKTVKLGADVDLKNAPWTPIGNWDNAFEGTFDGQGYTISNLYINAPTGEGVGLFGVAQNAAIKGINVHNVDIVGYSMVATIAGSPYSGCTVSDCHVTGKISLTADWAYVGGVVGYGYTKVENCSVIADGTGVIVAKTRNAVGGIAAWLLEDASSIKNCQVKNLELTGWANIGAITGFMHRLGVIDNCSAENVVLTKTRVEGIATVGLAAGGYNYNASKAITITNNTFKNITLNGTYVANAGADILYGGEYYGNTNTNFVLDNNVQENITNNMVEVIAVTNADELAAAVAAGKTDIYLLDGEYDVYGCAGKTLTLTGSKNAVIKLYNDGEDGCDYAFGGNGTGVGDVTFNGVTIDTTANTGNYKGFAYMKGTYNDCNFVGAFSLNNANDYTFNRCTFDFKNGYFWTWGANSVTFDGCTFNGNSKAILAHGYASTVITVKDCTFAATEKGYTGAGDNTAAVEMDPAGTNTYTVKITGSTMTESYADWYRVKDGSTGHSVFVNGDDVINTIKIGTLAELLAFANDVNVNGNGYSGKTVVLTADIDLGNMEWTPVGQTGGNGVATYFRGRFDGKGHTISNLKITNNAYDEGEHYAAGFFGFVDAGDANIVNLTIDGANVNGHHWTGVIAGYLTGNISGCTVKNATVNCTHANGDACGDKAGVIVGYVNQGTVTGNTVEDCTVTAGRDAGQVAGCAKAVYVYGNTISNVTVSAAGGCTGANIRNEEIGRLN